MKLYTTKIVAQYLDLSERRVRQLRDEGVLEEKAPGLYDLRSSVRRYINYLRGDEGGKADLNEERAKLTKEKRIAAETENKVRNGELYRKSDITVGMTTVVMNLRSRLLALPNKLAANIAKLDGDEGKIMDLLQSSLYEMQDARGVEVPSTKVNGDFEIELSALLAVSNKANISITVDPQVQALMKLVKAEIEKHNANADAHAATITAAVSAAVKNLSESGEILNEEQVKALIKEQVDGGTGGGYYGSYKLTLAADEWKPARSEDDYENAGGMDYYQCIYDAELSDSTSELVPVGVVSPGSFYTTTKAGVLNGCETHDGFIRFFAQRIPEADIQATVTLFGKGGGSGETGSVSIGQGLKRDASGAIAVRIGEGLDFDSANALTVRKETVMTSEDLLDEEETQQEIVDMLK